MVLAHIKAVRAQAEAIIASCDAMIQAAERIERMPPPCLHPKERRTDVSVMGEPPQFLCQACGSTVHEAEPIKEG